MSFPTFSFSPNPNLTQRSICISIYLLKKVKLSFFCENSDFLFLDEDADIGSDYMDSGGGEVKAKEGWDIHKIKILSW